ncbi:hypothetical protein AWC28_18860 [Mycolicibacter terrae]|nr:hypothetical protein AWC28_18860 [Mycolicibacter terrae]
MSIGTFIVTALGVALFVWLAWLLSDQPAPWRDPNGWRAFFSHVDGTEIFDAARTTATILAIIGIGGAALVAYRRQDTAERAHEVSIEAQQTAARQFMLDSDKYDLDLKRHQLETSRRIDDRERELRDRFTTIAEQLGSSSHAVRHAGAYALAALADDWHMFDNDRERQVCIDLLCAQLRSPRQQIEISDGGMLKTGDSPQDLEVRKTIVALIRSHRPVTNTDDFNNWKSCKLDLSGADLSGFNLEDIDLSAANLETVNLTHALLVNTDLSDANMRRTTLTGAEFTGSKLPRVQLYYAHAEDAIGDKRQPPVEFGNCEMQNALIVGTSLPRAQFAESDLTGASFGSSKMVGANFRKATLRKATLWIHLEDVTFRDADLRGTRFSGGNRPRSAQAEFIRVNFQGAVHDETTKWPNGEVPDGLQEPDVPG